MAEFAASPEISVCNCQVLRQANRRTTALYDQVLAPHRLRISQFAVLSRLRQWGPVGVQALAANLVLDRTTLGRTLAPLERDGLVASEPDPADRRVRRLVLTPAGLEHLRAARPAWRAAQARFEAAFGAVPAAELRETLHALTASLDQVSPDPA